MVRMLNVIMDFFQSLDSPVLQALVGTLFTWGMTAVGASLVFLVRDLHRKWLDMMLGFTGGVMIAASYWSLLAPAIAMSEELHVPKWLPASVGFVLGALFIYVLDKFLPHIHINFKQAEGIPTSLHRTVLLVLAITLHNIPEGMAVGVLFGGAALHLDGTNLGQAVALAIGIGLQNLPEGIAIAMPLRRFGLSRWKAFHYGQMSAIVEPLAAVLGAAFVLQFVSVLPYALAFAAGAMIYVVIEEVVPETQQDRYTDLATLGFIAGFVVMMILDVALG